MKTILYIEDDQGMRVTLTVLSRTCRQCFHGSVELLTAKDFSEGDARIQLGGIDVVLLDLTLPPFTAEETLSQFAQRAEKWPPTLIVTGDNDVALRQRAFAMGAADYLSKEIVGSCPEALFQCAYNAFLRDLYVTQKHRTE